MQKLLLLPVLLLLCLTPVFGQAGGDIHLEEDPWAPLQFQLYPGVEFYSPETPIYGINVAGVGGGTYIAGLSVHLFLECYEMYGFQLGLASLTNHFDGLQLSLYNSAAVNKGVQVGLFNSASGGFQVGLLNYNAKSAIPWMVFLNWGE